MNDNEHQLYLAKRQCLIMELGSLEDFLIANDSHVVRERSIIPRHKQRSAKDAIRESQARGSQIQNIVYTDSD